MSSLYGVSRALLLFPAVYLTSERDLAAAKQHLQRWWSDLPYVQLSNPAVLVENIVAYRHNPQVRWWEDEELGWINDSLYSFRNPKTRMCAFAERRFARVKQFLASIEEAA